MATVQLHTKGMGSILKWLLYPFLGQGQVCLCVFERASTVQYSQYFFSTSVLLRCELIVYICEISHCDIFLIGSYLLLTT